MAITSVSCGHHYIYKMYSCVAHVSTLWTCKHAWSSIGAIYSHDDLCYSLIRFLLKQQLLLRYCYVEHYEDMLFHNPITDCMYQVLYYMF